MMRHLQGTGYPEIYVGSVKDADDWEQLDKRRIKVILNVCNDINARVYSGYLYLKWGLDDPAETLAPTNNVEAAVRLLQEAVLQAQVMKCNVLIHCAAGNNRSALVAAVWLERYYKRSLKNAVKDAQVKDKKNWMIDKGFIW